MFDWALKINYLSIYPDITEHQSPEREIKKQKTLMTQCGCPDGGVIENGRTRNPLILWTEPVHVQVPVWVHILGDPPKHVQLRKATTTISPTQFITSKVKQSFFNRTVCDRNSLTEFAPL